MGRCARSRAPGWGCSPTSGASYGRSRSARLRVDAATCREFVPSSSSRLRRECWRPATFRVRRSGSVERNSGGTASPAVSARSSAGVRCSPSDNAWNENVSKLPVRSDSATWGPVRRISATGGRTMCTPTLAAGAYHPVQSRAAHPDALADQLHRLWRRKSRTLPRSVERTHPEGGSASTGDRRARRAAVDVPVELPQRTGAATIGDATRRQLEPRWNKLRPLGWTSAILRASRSFPASRYSEVAVRSITLRFTVAQTQQGYILPRNAPRPSSSTPTLPPMVSCPAPQSQLRPVALPRASTGDPARPEAIRH